MFDAEELVQAIAGLTGTIEVREDGERIPTLANFQHEVRAHGKRVILHLWSGERSLARAVVRIAHKETGRLLLEVECFGRARPGKLEFTSTEAARSETQLTRDAFREEFHALLREQSPDEEIETIANAADLEHSLSGRYVRAMMRAGSDHWAVLAAGGRESSSTIDAMMTFALIWMEHARTRVTNGRIAGLRVFFPAGRSKWIAHRAAAIDPRYAVELYELRKEIGRALRVQPDDSGNLLTRIVPRRDAENLLAAAEPQIAPICAIAPDAVTATQVAGTNEIALRYRGAQFARWRDGCVFFGIGDSQQLLAPDTRPGFELLLRDLSLYRRAPAEKPSHPFYRMHPERWLEMAIARDVARIDPQLDGRFVYSQVPAFSAGDRSVIDLLCVTRAGRLAILELKADEDIHLVMQAADYWLQVRRHQLQGDLKKEGYFPGVELSDEPPLLYLIAPAIRFHPATGTLLRYLSPEIEVQRVGVSEDWRKELRVVLHQ